MNESQKRLPHMWAKWRRGCGPNLEGYNGLQIQVTARYTTGSTAGQTILAMGPVEDTSNGWPKNKPVIFVVAPGKGYIPGQILDTFPFGTQRYKTIFPKP